MKCIALAALTIGAVTWIPDAAIMTLLLLAIFAVFFPWMARRYSREKPSKLQSFFELLVSGLRGLVDDSIEEGAHRKYLPIIGTFAIFIAAANLFGLFFFLQPPTGSLSTTVALDTRTNREFSRSCSIVAQPQ